MANNPLLQPYDLKHMRLRNQIMITSHEPAYMEDGMPKEWYRAYHPERAKAGVALTMTGGRRSSPGTVQPLSAISSPTEIKSCRGCVKRPTNVTIMVAQ